MAEDGTDATAGSIGRRVRAERQRRGWTQEDLAQHSGVSRRMLVSVEQGASNASIATLLKLAWALGVSLAALVEEPSDGVMTVRRAADRVVYWRGEHGGEAAMVATTQPPNVVELWDWTLGPGDEYVSETHSAGTRELIHVLTGRVRLDVDGHVVELDEGDAMTFASDRPHAYGNAGNGGARFSLSVFQPNVGA
jgi:transcriptional regulator with XRE-family HTH domain